MTAASGPLHLRGSGVQAVVTFLTLVYAHSFLFFPHLKHSFFFFFFFFGSFFFGAGDRTQGLVLPR